MTKMRTECLIENTQIYVYRDIYIYIHYLLVEAKGGFQKRKIGFKNR